MIDASQKAAVISKVDDPAKIRVVIFINDRQVHAPLTALVEHLSTQIQTLNDRITALESEG